MAIWKRKDRNLWVVDYRDASGKRKRVVGGTTRDDAKLVEATLTIQTAAESMKAAEPVPPDHDITLKDYAERWLKIVKPYLAQRTHVSYTHLLTLYIWPTLGAMKLREVRPLHVMQLLEEKRLTLGRNTVRLIKATLSTMFRHAVRHELIPVNPALGKFEEPGKRGRSPKVNSMSYNQVAQFKQTMDLMRQDGRLDLRWMLLFSTMAGTGLRPSEALALQPGDLDLSRRRLKVERALDYDGGVKPTKTDETRTVDLSDPLADSLRGYLTWLDLEAMAHGRVPLWLFSDDAGKVLTPEKIRHVFQHILKQAGLPPFTPYDLRHTFASLLLSANVPLLYVQKMLGHRNATTTLRYYATWMPSEDRRYMNLLEKNTGKAGTTDEVGTKQHTEVLDNPRERVGIPLMRNQNAPLRSRSATALM